MRKLKKYSISGQTSVEYILLLGMLVVMMLGISRQIRQHLIGTGDCPNTSLTCTIIGSFSGPGYLEGNYRYFTIKR